MAFVTPGVSESAPAMPEAKARIRSEPLTLVLEAISGIFGLTVKKYLITTDKDKAIEIPTAPILTARREILIIA